MKFNAFVSNPACDSSQAIHFSAIHSLNHNEYSESEEGELEIIQSKYEELISSYALSERQNTVLVELVEHLIHGCECPSNLLNGVGFSFSVEEGVVIHRRSNRGVTFIAIDEEGDSMFSFSSYNNKAQGRRIFFDYGSGSEEAMAYRLLAE